MSRSRQIIRLVLLGFVAVNLVVWGLRTFSPAHATGGGDQLPDDGVVVINFHGATRCDGCREIGREAQALVEEEFAKPTGGTPVHWRLIDFETAGNRHFVGDYALTSSTIVVVRRLGGKDATWQRLDDVWNHLYDGPAMRAYLKKEISALIAAPSRT